MKREMRIDVIIIIRHCTGGGRGERGRGKKVVYIIMLIVLHVCVFFIITILWAV